MSLPPRAASQEGVGRASDRQVEQGQGREQVDLGRHWTREVWCSWLVAQQQHVTCTCVGAVDLREGWGSPTSWYRG